MSQTFRCHRLYIDVRQSILTSVSARKRMLICRLGFEPFYRPPQTRHLEKSALLDAVMRRPRHGRLLSFQDAMDLGHISSSTENLVGYGTVRVVSAPQMNIFAVVSSRLCRSDGLRTGGLASDGRFSPCASISVSSTIRETYPTSYWRLLTGAPSEVNWTLRFYFRSRR